MRTAVAERRHELDLVRMPGVEETLRHLARKGGLLGVASGNLEAIGWIKIEQAGLREWFRFGGFSDHFPVRAELIGQAARKAREMAGGEASVCVVGDTPRDIEAAHANLLSVIAVATGRYNFDELLQHQPEVCATSLADLLARPRRCCWRSFPAPCRHKLPQPPGARRPRQRGAGQPAERHGWPPRQPKQPRSPAAGSNAAR
jgi:phosphoglycolate phosphatase-like HAD superfamily hydrolase